MKKVIKLEESDLTKIVKRVIKEQKDNSYDAMDFFKRNDPQWWRGKLMDEMYKIEEDFEDMDPKHIIDVLKWWIRKYEDKVDERKEYYRNY